jgi:hypothetical protein
MVDLEDLAHISVSTLKVFIPAFLKWLAHDEFAKHVHLPHGDALDKAMAVYARLGAPGACASADGVHVPWNNRSACEYGRQGGSPKSPPKKSYSPHSSYEDHFVPPPP